jgi:hypothetical protein
MAKRITFTDEQKKEIIRLYTEEKMGTPSIGEVFNVHKAVINRTLKDNGINLDQPGRRNIGGKKAADKRYHQKNKETIKQYYKEWAKNNREHLRNYHSEWREENRIQVNENTRLWYLNKRRTDASFRLKSNTRTAVYTCLKEKNVAKYRSTFEILGYTLEELMAHLEKQFTEGMSWENYGEWHVDHKIPMARFNFTSVEDPEFKLCWCLENLQPLWGPDNLSKGARYL